MSDQPTDGVERCEDCASHEIIRVWEDSDDWAAGEPPDFVGCEVCGVMER